MTSEREQEIRRIIAAHEDVCNEADCSAAGHYARTKRALRVAIEAQGEQFRLRQRAEAERDQLADDSRLFVPGSWICPKCAFALSRTTINVNTGFFGTTAADREESEPCPNDGTEMRRESWEERALAYSKAFSEKLTWIEQDHERLSRQVKIAVEALEQYKKYTTLHSIRSGNYAVFNSPGPDVAEKALSEIEKERAK